MSYKVSGYSVQLQKNFGSIPGLKAYWDGRYAVTQFPSSNKISALGDLSSNNAVLTARTTTSAPIWDGTKWIDSTSASGAFISLGSSRRDFNFLHNGQAFGIYSICYFTFHNATNVAYVPITTYATAGVDTGIRVTFSSTLNNGRININVINSTTGSSVRAQSLINLLTQKTFPGTYTWSHLFLGANISNNQVTRFEDLTATGTSSALVSAYNQGNQSIFALMRSNVVGEVYKTGILLIYDFTGFTQEQIISYDTQIRIMLELAKPTFI